MLEVFLLMLAAVAVLPGYDWLRRRRGVRLARLMDDPRYAGAVHVLWRQRRADHGFDRAVDYLARRGVDERTARDNLQQILGCADPVSWMDLAVVGAAPERFRSSRRPAPVPRPRSSMAS